MIRRLIILVIVLSFANYGMASAMSNLMPGAHSVVVKELDDITTNNTKDVNPPGLVPKRNLAWNVPKQPVPGYQITGMYEDSKFVLRIPKNWNGKLVVSASGGLAEETANDMPIGDFLLTHSDAKGASYAYACTDKGTRGEVIPDVNAGDTSIKNPDWNQALSTFNVKPDPNDPAHNDSAAEWVYRFRQLTMGAKEALTKLKGKAPTLTYAFGISNGGYTVRRALEENDDDLFDGGVDWEGVYYNADENNYIAMLKDLWVNSMIYTNSPALKNQATSEERAKAKAVLDKWLAPEAEFLWNNQADLFYWWTWKISSEFWGSAADPEFGKRYYGTPSGKIMWSKFGTNPLAFWDWDYYKRPASVRDYFRTFENTGKINKPLITVQGTWDVLVPPAQSALPYRALVEKNGKADIHRLYMIEHGTHLDTWVDDPKRDPGKKLTRVMPYAHQAFDLLVDWVENGKVPPANNTVPVPKTYGKVIDLKTGSEIDPY